MTASPKFFVMLGPPASGKGTQGRLFAEERGFNYLSTGSQLRREIEESSPIGQRAKRYLEHHQYVPDDLIIELVTDWLEKQEGGWLLDGFPRSVPQAKALLEIVTGELITLDLQVPADELSRRVSIRRECPECGSVATNVRDTCERCGGKLESRADDSKEGFQERYKVYRELTLPALDYLRSLSRVVEIDGVGSREEVAIRIKEALR